MPPTRIGVVGAGFIARRHVETLTALPDVTVAAVCDVQPDRTAALVSACGATPYADYTEMLARTPLDAVYVCVPPGERGGPERAVLQRGLGLFAEKPLAADLDTAEAIAADVAATGVPTAAGYHWRYL